jgi:hypothetical protein
MEGFMEEHMVNPDPHQHDREPDGDQVHHNEDYGR